MMQALCCRSACSRALGSTRLLGLSLSTSAMAADTEGVSSSIATHVKDASLLRSAALIGGSWVDLQSTYEARSVTLARLLARRTARQHQQPPTRLRGRPRGPGPRAPWCARAPLAAS